ncbi:winged helix-turn-helix domain-containing protein [Shewanella schlegeliana]|uniref:Winged helix-turn-helix transcriptional regulator n=1 Tax=Shewanella schlegeliana TaxID=190308 RepID=A0ABS1T2I4_9GAMM|nr:winged helix-turn-helix domain-containing protein [Shewanella schlegeliana]MBL4914889.1 winged helix-turn-helix transcriptional regulator [Shewanella schlegeliana]MCL1110420.1 winged helix-turn-helix domain-containing protein [Shewanella schlegeliana]
MHKVTPYLELDEEAKQLIDHANNQTITLTVSESAVLHQLILSMSSVCTKEELLAAGWPDRVVAATSLTQCVSTLRKKLEPYPEVVLRTIAGRGYQLNVSTRSHIKMLAVNDPESMRAAIVDVSLLVKISGIVIAILICLSVWYFSDYHGVIKAKNSWDSTKNIELNIGGTKQDVQLIHKEDVSHLHASMWQKHLAPESNHLTDISQFKGFAVTDGHYYSMAVCPEASDYGCSGKGLINITAIDLTPAGLNMKTFTELTHEMEQRIRYNRVIIPHDEPGTSGFIEHHYHADVYYPVKANMLVRSDISLSLIYEGENTGKFYSAACVTDEECKTTPIKYKIKGDFTQYREKIDELEVDVFHVKVSQKELIKPDQVSSSAMHFYREIRKHEIIDSDLYFYRIYKDADTAVWIVPILGNLVAWYEYDKVKL